MPGPTWTDNDVKRQFDRAEKNGWLPLFAKSAADCGFDRAVLIGIASRETNMRNIVGDGGHGYGLMQIDDRSFPDFCHSGLWQDVGAVIDKGAHVLKEKRDTIRAGQGKALKIGAKFNFTGKPNLTDAELLATSIAAYNSGLWAYWGLSTKGDPDLKTTMHDYSADTLKRIALLRTLGA